ncbi:MAG: hypothetical protein ACRD40_18345 [Candidatus Acidiferrales bacterium]
MFFRLVLSRAILSYLMICAVAAMAGAAQRGQAPAGCYPFDYFGMTWSGAVTAVDDQNRTITLTLSKGSKTQTFVGTLADGFSVKYTDGTVKDLQPSDIPINAPAIAYFKDYTKKVNGKKIDVHEVFMLTVKTSDGQEHTYKSHFDPKYKDFSGQSSPAMTGALDPCAVQKQ